MTKQSNKLKGLMLKIHVLSNNLRKLNDSVQEYNQQGS